MRYEEPRIISSGDMSIIVYMGYGMELDVNSAVIAANRKVLQAKAESTILGIIDTIPGWYSFAVYYDNQIISLKEITEAVYQLAASVGKIEMMDSRIIEVPCIYGTEENGTEWGPDLASSAEYSGLTVEEAVKAHTDANQWVGLVGFQPSSPFTTPLKKSDKILLGKVYDTPRSYTPAGFVGQGGACCAWYNLAGAGGYAMVGYLPALPYEPTQTQPDFYDNPMLLRAGDRIRYKAIDVKEYREIAQLVKERRYRFKIKESVFNIKAYLEGDEDDVESC